MCTHMCYVSAFQSMNCSPLLESKTGQDCGTVGTQWNVNIPGGTEMPFGWGGLQLPLWVSLSTAPFCAQKHASGFSYKNQKHTFEYKMGLFFALRRPLEQVVGLQNPPKSPLDPLGRLKFNWVPMALLLLWCHWDILLSAVTISTYSGPNAQLGLWEPLCYVHQWESTQNHSINGYHKPTARVGY